MASSVSNLVNNLSERILSVNTDMMIKKFETYGMKYMY